MKKRVPSDRVYRKAYIEAWSNKIDNKREETNDEKLNGMTNGACPAERMTTSNMVEACHYYENYGYS